MTDAAVRPVPRWARLELPGVLLVAWLAFVSIPLGLGEIGIGWDALNHHFYLGWIAEHPRFGQDFLAASYQSYQFPYLYWPAYRLAAAGLTGAQAGAVLASLQLVAVIPVWLVARTCIPGREPFDAFMRVLAVVLAFASGVILSLFDSTSNDLLAAAPLVWAIAMAMAPWDAERARPLAVTRAIALSGVLAGVSVACKLSNGPLAILLPLIWWAAGDGPLRQRLVQTVVGCAGALAGFLLAYGYWGWQLWHEFGNPVYPFGDHWFAILRAWLGIA